MKEFTILLLLVGLSPNALGQAVLDDSGVVMISPIIWEPMVYVNADRSLTELVYGKIFDSKPEVTLNCEVPNKYLWYCNKTKPVVFQGLDGQGKKTKRFFYVSKIQTRLFKNTIAKNNCHISAVFLAGGRKSKRVFMQNYMKKHNKNYHSLPSFGRTENARPFCAR